MEVKQRHTDIQGCRSPQFASTGLEIKLSYFTVCTVATVQYIHINVVAEKNADPSTADGAGRRCHIDVSASCPAVSSEGSSLASGDAAS